MDTPKWLYGTAWKKEQTRDLVVAAVKRGFRAIDTANQPKHYNEPAVGEALTQLAEAGISREELFLQTKYTPVGGQDERVPYDPQAPVSEQVAQSFASSLEHLGVTTLDSFLLHGPFHQAHLGAEDFEAWNAMTALKEAGKVRHIGISNFNPIQLAELLQAEEAHPRFLQNRCFASQGWDGTMREICREFGIQYQGFSLLTANGQYLDTPPINEPAERLGISPCQVVFCFARQVGILPLTGTTDPAHMEQDLATTELTLTDEEVQRIETIANQK